MSRERIVFTVIAAVLLTAAAANLWPQSSEDNNASRPSAGEQTGPSQPDDTEIVVPDLALEIEEDSVTELIIELPTIDELEVSSLSLPLPEIGELEVDEDAFLVNALPSGIRASDGQSIYSNGRLGAGSSNHIIGEVTVFKIGVPPEFRLEFGYEGLDGFQGRSPGTGYFLTENRIAGGIDTRGEELSLEAEASYDELERGLQGQSEFFSVEVRSFAGAATLRYRPEPVFELAGSFDGSWANRILTKSELNEAPRDQEVSLAPRALATLTFGVVDLRMGLAYTGVFSAGGAVSEYQESTFTTGIRVTPTQTFAVDGNVSVLWEFGDSLRYPFDIEIQALLGEGMQMKLSGGLAYKRPRYYREWQERPLLPADTRAYVEALELNERWFVSSGANWSLPGGVNVRGSLGYRVESGAVEVTGYEASETALLFHQRRLEAIDSALELAFRPGLQLQAELGVRGSFIDRRTGASVSVLSGAVEYRTNNERVTLGADTELTFYPEAGVPWIVVNAAVNVADGVDLELEAKDLLAPLFAGRPEIGAEPTSAFPFIEPGFRATILTRISL